MESGDLLVSNLPLYSWRRLRSSEEGSSSIHGSTVVCILRLLAQIFVVFVNTIDRQGQ